jgi:hypothetical protein
MYRSSETIPALTELENVGKVITLVRNDIVTADTSRTLVGGLLQKIRGQSAPVVGAVQLESERFLVEKRTEWLTNFSQLIHAVAARVTDQIHNRYPTDAPLASYEEIVRWVPTWQEFQRTHPPDGPLFGKVSWAGEWNRFKNTWLSLKYHLPDEANTSQTPRRDDSQDASPRTASSSQAPTPETPLSVEVDRSLKKLLPDPLAIQVKAAFFQSHFYEKAARAEVLALLEQITKWHENLRSRFGQSPLADRTELHEIARRMIEPYNGAQFASESEIALITSALDRQAPWLKQRELIQYTTVCFARRLMRVTPQQLALRSAAPKVHTPYFAEPVDRFARPDEESSVEHRLGLLSETYQQLYPGLEILYMGNRGGTGEFLVYQPLSQVQTPPDNAGANPAFMGGPESSCVGIVARVLQKLMDGERQTDTPTTIDVYYSNKHPDPETPSTSAPVFDLDGFIASLHEIHANSVLHSSHPLSHEEDSVSRRPRHTQSHHTTTISLVDAPGIELHRDSKAGLVVRTQHGYFSIRNGHVTPLQGSRANVLDEVVHHQSNQTPISVDECFDVHRLVLDENEHLAVPHGGPDWLSHGTVVVHLDELAGVDALWKTRIELMAETSARFDPQTAVILQGSEETVLYFARFYETIGKQNGGKPPIFTDSIGVPNAQRAVHIGSEGALPEAMKEKGSQTVLFSNTSRELESDPVSIPLFAPRFFDAQRASRRV